MNDLDKLILGFKRKHLTQKTIIRVVKEFTKIDKDSLSVNYRELLKCLSDEDLINLTVTAYVLYMETGRWHLLRECRKELARRKILPPPSKPTLKLKH